MSQEKPYRPNEEEMASARTSMTREQSDLSYDREISGVSIFTDPATYQAAKDIVAFCWEHKDKMLPLGESSNDGTFTFEGKEWRKWGSGPLPFVPLWAGEPLSSKTVNNIMDGIHDYESIAKELEEPGEPSIGLAIEMGIKDNSYNVVRGGLVSSYSGKVVIRKGGETWEAEGYGPKGTPGEIKEQGGINFRKIEE